MIHKGMDYPLKIELICNLKILDIIESFSIKYPDRIEDVDLDEQDNEELFYCEMSVLVDHIGQWCLEMHQNCSKLLPSVEH